MYCRLYRVTGVGRLSPVMRHGVTCDANRNDSASNSYVLGTV
jgi:hypothetical protein